MKWLLESLEKVVKVSLALGERIEKTKSTISRNLEKLKTLTKALMQEYFG